MEEIIYKIQPNKIKCKKCGSIIESKDLYDFQYCSCKAVAVGGGNQYLKRIGNEEDYEELSYIRKLVKINTKGYKVIKSKYKQDEVLLSEDIKCPKCHSNRIDIMKGDGEEIIGCDIIAIICHDCEKIFEFSDIKYKKSQEIDLSKIRQLEIVDELKRCVKDDCDFYLEHDECYELLDYILNLQNKE